MRAGSQFTPKVYAYGEEFHNVGPVAEKARSPITIFILDLARER